jgi:hypothetical protein
VFVFCPEKKSFFRQKTGNCKKIRARNLSIKFTCEYGKKRQHPMGAALCEKLFNLLIIAVGMALP